MKLTLDIEKGVDLIWKDMEFPYHAGNFSHLFHFFAPFFFYFCLTPHSSSSGAGRQGLLHVRAITLSPDCHHTRGGRVFFLQISG